MKKKSPYRWLLLIPIQLVLDIVLFYICIAVDSALPRLTHPNDLPLGHPAPAFTILAAVVLPIITVIVVIIAIIVTLVALAKAPKRAPEFQPMLKSNEYLRKQSGELDLSKDLFLCPIYYDGDPVDANGVPLPLTYDDREIHFSSTATSMFNAGSRIHMSDVIPSYLSPATVAGRGIMHFRTTNSPDGQSYIPLFTGFESMVRVFGYRMHVGVITYEDAKNMCISEEKIAGIVLGPGQINKIMPRQTL